MLCAGFAGHTTMIIMSTQQIIQQINIAQQNNNTGGECNIREIVGSNQHINDTSGLLTAYSKPHKILVNGPKVG